MKIAFIYGNRLSSRLTRIFTSSTCYHIGFTDGRYFWDQHFTFRRREWADLYDPRNVILAQADVAVTPELLNAEVARSTQALADALNGAGGVMGCLYGVRDYFMFGFRWLYHLLGQSTPNFAGEICSEVVARINRDAFAEVPSPADLEERHFGVRDAIKKIPTINATEADHG